jgi:hypothetical protein
MTAVSRRGRRAGAELRLTLSESASVELRVYKRVIGRTVGGRCVRSTAANRSAALCRREVRVPGAVRTTRPAGAQRLWFSASVNGRRLTPGSYHLVVVATDAAGNRTTTRGTLLRVVR